MWLVGKLSSEKRSNMQDLPTEESPIIMSLMRWSYCFLLPPTVPWYILINYKQTSHRGHVEELLCICDFRATIDHSEASEDLVTLAIDVHGPFQSELVLL